MNKVILMGRLTRDPDVRDSSKVKVAKYTLAVDRRFKSDRQDAQNADFISCTAFGVHADFAEKWLRQGKKIVVTGRLETSTYTNRDGQKVFAVDVIIEDQEFAESKASEQSRGGSDYGSGGAGYPGGYGGNSGNSGKGNSRSTTGYHNQGDGFMNIPDGIDEELPFN